MSSIKKAYGYMTRIHNGKPQILVFQHSNPEAGIQIPKGTVKMNESPYQAVIREMEEETGLTDFNVEKLLAEDYWENDDGKVHHRYFYQINVSESPEEWNHQPTGGGVEEGLTFRFFWISSKEEVELVRGHGDYLHLILE